MNIFPRLEQILKKNVIFNEKGFTLDSKQFIVIVYQEESNYNVYVAVEGGHEKITEFSSVEDAKETAQMAFDILKTKSFEQSPLQSNPVKSQVDRPASIASAATALTSSTDPVVILATTLTQVVTTMQVSNENNSKRLERIIDQLQDNQVKLQNTLVSEQQKTREFMREISIQNADLHMKTAQMLTDMNIKTLENATAQQNRFLEHQQHVLAIESANREREEIARQSRKERQAQKRREHEEKMEKILSQSNNSGILETVIGTVLTPFKNPIPSIKTNCWDFEHRL